MALLQVERIGGLAGFGGVGAHVRSLGRLETDTLSPEEQRAVEDLFKSKGKAKASQIRDGFRYRISRTSSGRTETVEAPEGAVPKSLAQCVKDELV
jgi:hypothetical protein